MENKIPPDGIVKPSEMKHVHCIVEKVIDETKPLLDDGFVIVSSTIDYRGFHDIFLYKQLSLDGDIMEKLMETFIDGDDDGN